MKRVGSHGPDFAGRENQKDDIKALEGKIAELLEANSCFELEAAKLNQQLADNRGECQSQIAALERKLAEVTQEATSFRAETLRLDGTVTELRKLSLAHDEVIRLTRKNVELEAEVFRLNQEVAEARDQNALATARIAFLESEKAALVQEQNRWFRTLAVAVSRPLTAAASRIEDFRRAVNLWNTILEITGPRCSFHSDPIPVTCNSTWELHGSKQFTGPQNIVHYIGLDCFTDSEGTISTRVTDLSVNRVDATDAQLAEPCKVGDKVLKLKGDSVSSWPSKLKVYAPSGRNYQCVAFGPDKLPNFQLSPCISRCQMNDNVLEVELYEGVRHELSAGTAARMHIGGGAYVYGHGGVISDTWSEFKMNQKTHPLRVGTHSVRIVVLYCHSVQGDPMVRSVSAASAIGCSLKLRNFHWETGE
jgi:hypothetical protein